MYGIVKWFSSAKGYGFISSGEAENKDYYFNKREILGFKPNKGDYVSFDVKPSEKGESACKIELIGKTKSNKRGYIDDRVTCYHCNKKMVPRMIHGQYYPVMSVCPFCGNTFKTFKNKHLIRLVKAVFLSILAFLIFFLLLK